MIFVASWCLDKIMSLLLLLSWRPVTEVTYFKLTANIDLTHKCADPNACIDIVKFTGSGFIDFAYWQLPYWFSRA